MQIDEFKEGMLKHFGIPYNDDSYIESYTRYSMGRVIQETSLDILKFKEDYLIPKVDGYDEKEKSIRHIVEELFGIEACEFVRKAIKRKR